MYRPTSNVVKMSNAGDHMLKCQDEGIEPVVRERIEAARDDHGDEAPSGTMYKCITVG